MNRQAKSFLAAVGVIFIAVAGIAWAVATEKPGDPGGIAKVSYGPTPSEHPFKATVEGKDGPLGGCVVCHSIERRGTFRVAPGLWGIVGADKARAGWFAYSSALAKAEGTWTAEDLDTYLTKPNRFLPGTKKTLVGIPDAEKRAAIIGALEKLR